MTQKNSVLKATGFMALATSLSRVFGLVREQVVAYYFGAGPLVDAFNVAFRIPNLLRDLLAEGAFSSSFLAQFAFAKTQGTTQMQQLFRQCFWILLLLGLGYAFMLIFFSSQLIPLFAPDYAIGSKQALLTVELLKIMSPFLMLMSLGAVVMAVLNTHKVFFLPSFSPVLFNISSILVVLFAAIKGNPGIQSLAVGVLLGGFFQLAIQLPGLWKLGYSLMPPKKIWGPEVKKVFTQLIPGLVGFAASQINILINTILATSSGVGAVSWLSYSFRIFQLPLGVIGVSIGTGNQVFFSEKWKEKNYVRASEILTHSLFLSLCFMLLPFTFLVVFPDWPIEVLFQRGQFSALDTTMCAQALFAYSFGLPFYGIHKILLPVFYTLEKQKLALVIAVVSILINILFATFFVKLFGFSFLAWSSSISIAVNSISLFCFLPRQLFPRRMFFTRRERVTLMLLVGFLFLFFSLFRLLMNFILVGKIFLLLLVGLLGYFLLEVILFKRGHELLFLSKLIKKMGGKMGKKNN
ncbi:MAG: murein biosynthesis integral membrane protein MurJ [Bacteriovoracaceae bacterium]|nr:murein biosynthesis integral membrane protein MurJ [Bacteriovoracaceae bacterium]